MERPTGPALPRDDIPFLLSPLAGYPLALDLATSSRLESAHRELLVGGDADRALRVASEILSGDPGLHPALLLAAQADFARGRFESVPARLGPVVAELPDYLAAQLLLGRAAERLDDVVTAYAAYHRASDSSSSARQRAEALRFRALQIVYNRARDASERGRIEEARRQLGILQEWAPDDTTTLQAARRVAAAAGDARAELAALARLVERLPGDRALLERRAELEVEVGDAGAGLRVLQELASQNPDDAELAEKLARAKFRWRLVLLPPEIGELVSRPELARGDFAALIYWIFPDVRYGRPASARIANDVFDHPFREEIVRVVNLGLMTVDTDLHRFEPARPVRQLEVLSSLVRLLAQHRPPLACVRGAELNPRPTAGFVCRAAARCGLIDEEADCLPAAAVSGTDAIELGRRAMDELDLR